MSRRPLTTEQFIILARNIHGQKYDYSKVVYVTSHIQIIITCPIHGESNQTPNAHLVTGGCKQCGVVQRREASKTPIAKLQEQFTQIHGDLYGYELVTEDAYTNSHSKLSILCKKHRRYFTQTANKHLMGQGCPMCKDSKGEVSIRKFLVNNDIPFKTQHDFNKKCRNHQTNKPLRFDFYVPTFNLCIEFDGIQHVDINSSFAIRTDEEKLKRFQHIQYLDQLKTQFCIDNDIKLLRIPHTDINNISSILSMSVL